ncbi:AlbA family DNA-binding domain-containing protein [Bacteroides uniformis]|uniref:AlbA family DNA-binding domain-containing protein n=1 Tax=Bacteroides uniformis TaxID=820 RepID=UPI0040403F1B
MKLETLDDIKNLITSDTETDKIEFKKTTGQLERGMETLCAFLDQEGGTVLFGVTDEGKITGQEVAGKTKETIGEAISRLEPGPKYGFPISPYPRVKSWKVGDGASGL